MLTGLNGQMIVPQEQTRTFDWGKQGQIEMRPFEEAASAWFGQPARQQEQPQQDEVLSILNRQRDEQLNQLEMNSQMLQGSIEKDTRYSLDMLVKEHQIKLNALYDKHGLSPFERQTGRIRGNPEDVKKITNEINNLNTQYTVAMERAKSKIQPDLDELQMKKQQQLNSIQQSFAQKQMQIQIVRDLAAKGVIQNPAAALQEQYQILGITVPLSSFESQAKTPKQQLNDVTAALRILKGQIPTKTQYVDGQLVQAGQAPEGVKEQIAELEELQRQLVPQVYPQYVQSSAKVTPLSRAATKALVGDGEIGGTLAGRVQAAKNTPSPYSTAVKMAQKNKLSAEEARQILTEAGGDKELARQIAKSRGYSL